ncbi:hypothetical protein [Methylobacterium sp. NEAU K]|uniref:hypothetical protein n=1 Tax=Methylobacterium sp. NEAU K TaxID=3064946 RepID=UPI002736EB4E|nr:hypothetical protein [Methylobacterium sp. NEAU K]MDP4005154.1 hypothetical protein [Methylobacterium sp. NEAU K]
MTFRFLTAAALLAASLGGAQAAEIRPVTGSTLGLGPLSGVAYYTVEPKGYHVVVTLAPRGAAPALRLEAVLAADQSVTLSTPRAAGEPAEAIEIERAGDHVFVSAPPATGVVQEADAVN